MSVEEKLCVDWKDFQENLKTSFAQLRSDEDFADVTLACEDADFEVHKLILASVSPFFRAILTKTKNRPHPLIYLRGVRARELEAVVDFAYQGEANILQENLEDFLALAEELQLKGLAGLSDEEEEVEMQATKDQTNQEKFDAKLIHPMKTGDSQHNDRESEITQSTFPSINDSVGFKEKPVVHVKEETKLLIRTLIRKGDRLWRCVKCRYTSKKRSHISVHVEKHIVGLEYLCNLCGKVSKTSSSAKQHRCA